MSYIIVGDTEKYEGCLVRVVYGDIEVAEKALQEVLNGDRPEDVMDRQRHKNIRIKEVEEKDCWWNDPFLAN